MLSDRRCSQSSAIVDNEIFLTFTRQILTFSRWEQKGTIASEATLDSKGRVLIPDEIRKKVGLTTGSRLRVSATGNAVVIRMRMEPEDFIGKTKGALKKGSKVKRIDLLKLKEIWIRS
ncbi:MAG: AbrB/MazE/SpoVT family DNA-binding domain-containing protein [Thaumarchaeota archaeon]|nr:AbrB/MazE/SpoVT family DNA-binding domain-containing protein [Nitrososphaerota archaeon]